MAQTSQASQNLLKESPENGTGEKPFVCTLCDKGYKREVYLKMHMRKIHGIENSVMEDLDRLDETDFMPGATSTAEDFSVKQEGERDEGGYPMITDKPIEERKKRPRSPSSSEVEEVEDLATAKKAKEGRMAMREQMNIERELQMGYDADQEPSAGPSTQEINEGLAKVLKEQEETLVEEPSQLEGNISESTSGRIIDLDLEVTTLKRQLANKETALMDARIRLSEANDTIDGADRVVREMREVIKLKNAEIQDLVKDAKEFNDRLKKSPLKEELKANTLKAENKIKQQANHIKNLETQLKKANTNSRPEVEKLKKQAQDLLTRSEHYTREEMRHLNSIAALKKKIPCGDMPECDQGKKCPNSHVLRYAKPETEKMKMVPCIHYLNGRCKFQNADDCRYAHVRPEGSNRTIEIGDDEVFRTNHHRDTVTSARSESIMEVSGGPSFSRMAANLRPSGSGHSGHSGSGSKPPAKRYKLVEDYDSGNSYATDKFPDPVPAQSNNSYWDNKRQSSRYVSLATEYINNNGKNSGNAKGAQGKRSSQGAPSSTRGSRDSPRMERGRYQSARPAYRERSEENRGSWEKVRPRRRDSRGPRGQGGHSRW